MIVGVRYEQYATLTIVDYGNSYRITQHRMAFELHSTKGWRPAGRSRRVLATNKRPSRGDLLAMRGREFRFRPGVGQRNTNGYGFKPLQVRP